MIRRLLSLCIFLAASVTFSFAQTDPTLGQAGSFTVLATTEIINTGQTGITGNVGVSPGTTIVGEELLKIERGRVEKGTTIAANARADAISAYNSLSASTPAIPLLPIIGTQTELAPGTYKTIGDLSLQGVLTLNGLGNLNSVFIIIVNGNINSSAPNAAIRLVNGAQAKNIYWVVSGGVELGSVSSMQGNVLAQQDIILHNGTIVAGRVISLTGKIVLNSNNLYTPTIVEPNLSITKSAPVKAYLVGDLVTYTITVHNAGPGAATEVVVKENFPANLRYVQGSAVFNYGVYDETNHLWDLGLLQVTESREIKLTFEIVSGGTIVNIATVDSKETDPQVDNNTDEETIIVPELEANLNVTKVATGAPYMIGGTVTYTITVKNTGNSAAAGVTLTEQLPAGLEYVSSSVSQGVYTPATGVHAIGVIQPGGQATLTIIARITKQGPIANSVVVTSNTDVPEKDPTDNTDEEIIDVLCDPVVGFGITGNSQVCEGASSNTTFTVTPIADATYTFTLTGGLTEVSRSGNSITVRAGTTSGKIEASATNVCGETFKATKEVTVVNRLSDPTITGPTTICANSTNHTYSVTAYDSDVTYTWTTTGGLSITGNSNAASIKVNAGATGGKLTLVVSNSCFTTQPTSIDINANPVPDTPGTITGSQAVCIGNEVTYSITAVTGASDYTWTLPAKWRIVSGENTSEITVKIEEGAATGNVSVKANNECGSSAAKTKAVTVNDKLAASAITGKTRGCIGEQITYTIPAVNGATSYEWSVPETWKLVSQNENSIVAEVGTGNGQVQVGVNNMCGQGEKATLAVAPTLAPTQNNQIVGEATACLGNQNLTYTLTTVQADVTYNWTLPEGLTMVSGDGTGTITVKAIKGVQGPISVLATNSCGTAPRISLNVTITAPPAAPGMVSDNSNVCDGLSYSIDAVQGATGYLWTVPIGFTITAGQGTTSIKVKADRVDATGQVSVVAQNGACNSPATSTFIDASLADGELSFPKAFSPNGDGINDEWVVKNLTKYSNNEVTIFNRWGSEVYKTKNYQNNWRANNLEQGTYFYKVRVTVCDGVVKEFTGYVTLFR